METKKHILIIDDSNAIHDDFRMILAAEKEGSESLDSARNIIFGDSSSSLKQSFELDSAFQGQEGLAKVTEAVESDCPYFMAFVDVRMPPGWDGIETIKHLWEVQPDLQVVICTAYSDYSWESMIKQLGQTDRLLILKKPFDNVEVHQLACSLSEKWDLLLQSRLKEEEMEKIIEQRTQENESVNKKLVVTLDKAKQISETMKAQEDEMGKLALAASYTPNIVIITDSEGQVTWTNKWFSHLTGYTTSEVLGKKVYSVIDSRTETSGAAESMKDHIEYKEKFSTEILSQTKSGKEIWLKIMMEPIFDASYQLVNYIIVEQDITDLKNIQQALEISNLDLQLSGEKLKNAELEVRKFAEFISDKLENSLSNIYDSGTGLEESIGENLDETNHRKLKLMIDEAERISEATKQISGL